MTEATKAMLVRMPLAEAILWLWRWIIDNERMVRVWEANRGRCYEKVISFPVILRLMADALLQYGGSGRRSFEKGRERGELEASIQAAFGKLRRIPLPLSEAFLAEGADALRAVFPRKCRRKLPKSLNRFHVIILDGKSIKKVFKRLLPLRGVSGGLLGGRGLVALDWRTGLVVGMRGHLDGDANEVGLVGTLVPLVRRIVVGARLWVADRAFCDLTQPAHFLQKGDHYLVRYHSKNKFHPDPKRRKRTGRDANGLAYVEQWGWLGSPSNPRRQEVRLITLPGVTDGGKKDLILVTDLLDADVYPAADLLALYAERWGIENVFQQVTEVFGLQRLIGSTPQACLFQFAFCLLLYNLIQVVRAYVAEAQQREIEEISAEKLFDDVHRELIAWSVTLDVQTTESYFESLPCVEMLRTRLQTLLASSWSDTWIKSPKPKNPRRQRVTANKPKHESVYRILQNYRPRPHPAVASS